MLTIYGIYRSRAARVYWMARELEIPFRSVPVHPANDIDDPASPSAPLNSRSTDYLAINPMGQIPAIDDAGLILTESLAINLYLARKHGGPLAARTFSEEGKMMSRTIWAATSVEPHTVRIVRTFDKGKENTEEGRRTIEEAVLALKQPFGVLESQLENSGYVVSDRFTVADLNLAEVLRYAMTQEALFEDAPRVKNWLARCQSRSAFKAMMEERSKERD